KDRGRKKGNTPAPELLGKEHEPDDLIRSPYRIGFGRRIGRVFAATLVAGGLAIGIGLISGDPALAGVSFGIIMTAVVGIGLGNKIANWLGPDHPQLFGRLLVLAFAAPAAAIVYGAVFEGRVGREWFEGDLKYLYVPLLGAFAVFNWRERIRNGLRGELGIWLAFWSGVLAFAATMPFNDNEHAGAWMGMVVGSVCLSIQAFSWAMIRNPQRVLDSAESAVGLPDDVVPSGSSEAAEAQGARRLVADDGTYLVAGVSIGDDRYRDLPAQHVRAKALRVLAGLLAFGSALGIIAVSICLGVGVIGCDADEWMGSIVGIVAMSLFFLFWLGKTTRTKRVGAWSEWLNPFLRVGVGTALATGITGLAVQKLNNEALAGMIILVVFSALALLALLIFRQSKRKQLAKYRRGERDDRYGPDDLGPGGGMRVGPAIHDQINDVVSKVVQDVEDAVVGMGKSIDFTTPAKARSPIAPRSAGQSWWPALVALLIICLTVSLMLSPGRRNAPHVGSGLNLVHIDKHSEKTIAIVESHSHVPSHSRSSSDRKTYAGLTILTAMGAAFVLLLVCHRCQRRKSPPEFLKKP
ncbi:MAG: hypothetical protein O7D91_08325, partial [Planctomycetota bacterium]|nr:hypothetical protein [Planctomycetota bacterium]